MSRCDFLLCGNDLAEIKWCESIHPEFWEKKLHRAIAQLRATTIHLGPDGPIGPRATYLVIPYSLPERLRQEFFISIALNERIAALKPRVLVVELTFDGKKLVKTGALQELRYQEGLADPVPFQQKLSSST